MKLIQIFNGKILTPQGWINNGSILVNEGRILAITGSSLPLENAEMFDASGRYVIPGYVAMNIYGAAGSQFHDATEEAFNTVINTHLAHGTTTIFPTVGAVGYDKLLETGKICTKLMEGGNRLIGGLHIVGPYLSPEITKGRYEVKLPDRSKYEKVVSELPCIKRWDASPELPGAQQFARFITRKGILAAISHTMAEYGDVKAGFDAGFVHAAQLYNAMAGFHKRREYKYEGTVESVLLIDEMTTEVIADLVHLPATILRLVYKLKGVERTALVTAALRYAAYDGEELPFSKVYIENGICKLKSDGTVAGGISTMDQLVRNMVIRAEVPFEDAVRMASETPARIMNVIDRVGTLEKGKDADILLLDHQYNLTSVWSKGVRIF